MGFARSAVAMFLTLAATAPACAQATYPTRPVHIVMPFPAGSSTDILARIVAKDLTEVWGQAVIVDNLVGAGGNIGTANAYRATPDGYTLLFAPPPPLVINFAIYKNPGYEADRWQPITMISQAPYVLDVRNDFPASNVKELLAYAKANPGKVTYASAGIGSTMQLYSLEMEKRAGISMVHVPYRGAAPALTDLMAGQVDMLFDVITTSLPLLADNKVKPIAVGGLHRSPVLPNVPTLDESGLPGMQAITWFGMVAPPKTPDAIVDKISRDVRAALKKPDIQKLMQSLQMETYDMSPAETGKFLADERDRWSKLARDANITIE